MAFKTRSKSSTVAPNPAAHLRGISNRKIPDVLPHQKVILEHYAQEAVDLPDVAVQLPTGGGKTLVGLLIADWRRVKDKERVLFLCPTRQLAAQVVDQAKDKYGISAINFSGRKAEFNAADEAAYRRGKAVAVAPYSALFNSNPFFTSPDLIIADDAHVAENYIASPWTLDLPSEHPAHAALIGVLRSTLTKRDIDRLEGNWEDRFAVNWVDKVPSPVVRRFHDQIHAVLQANIPSNDQRRFAWRAIEGHLSGCHIYLSSRSITIRPIIPPTWTHAPFNDAKQRVFMSATLGEGGDTERLTGRTKIVRLPSPDGFERDGVGRRFFMFPTLSLDDNEAAEVRLRSQALAKRSVVLTPSSLSGRNIEEEIKARLHGYEIFSSSDIETRKSDFAATDHAVAVLPGRFDGIDFPGDDCRLLCIDGFPGAMNPQERFIMSKMSARALYSARLQIRVLQAIGRCTRALNDRAAVLITGKGLVDSLTDQRKWKFLKPELQAELEIGVEQSTDAGADDFVENLELFLADSDEWHDVEDAIQEIRGEADQETPQYFADLSASVSEEVKYLKAVWNGDERKAAAAAAKVHSLLKHPELRGYRSLWHYLEGSAVDRLKAEDGDLVADEAKPMFLQAKNAAPGVSWLTDLAYRSNLAGKAEETTKNDLDLANQVENIASNLEALGSTGQKFENAVAEIRRNLRSNDGSTFERGVEELGGLLGWESGNSDADAAPDPWWIGATQLVVFEAYSEATADRVFGTNKVRQVITHPTWLDEKLPHTASLQKTAIALTDAAHCDTGGPVHLGETLLWTKQDFLAWSDTAIETLRGLREDFTNIGDFVWTTNAMQSLEDAGLTLQAVVSSLPLAKEAFIVTGN